jgi:ORF6N domain-containing protein
MKSADASKNVIDTQIHVVRGVSVMLDFDLAILYGVPTGVLLQAVRRNRKRFPSDFMFPLSAQEVTRLRSQIVISKLTERRGGRRYQVHAFTEQGVAMLSSVLRSEIAVRVNIEIMRAFVRLRRAGLVSAQLMALVEDLSKRVDVHDAVITDIVESIRQIVAGPGSGRARPIGFTADLECDG